MIRKSRVVIVALLVLTCTGMLAQRANAWWSGGHKMCTLAALQMLPADFPAFFKAADDELAEMCVEPDEWKSVMTPRLKISEGPEHYIDMEHFEGGNFPRLRYEALKHYATEVKVDLARGGTLPYALEEGYERLLLAFRKVRIYPDSKAAKNRAIVYAGWLAHYCQDAGMPLHTTVNYDGKPGENGRVLQRGIHARLDSYPEKNGFTPELLAKDQRAERVLNPWAAIEKQIKDSHKLVEKAYEIDAQDGFSDAPEKAREYVLERARASAKLTADLWYTAWVKSDPAKATIK